MWRPGIFSFAVAVVLLISLLAACAVRESGDVGQQRRPSDDAGAKSETSHDAQSKIAFERVLHGNGDVYAIKADGTGVVRLTDLPGMVGSPAWQPVD